MNMFKVYKYLQELMEVILTVLYCLLEFIVLIVIGLFLSGVVVYYSYYYGVQEQEFANILYALVTIAVFIFYAVGTKVYKYIIKYLKSYTAVYFSMIGQIAIVYPVIDFYYGDDIKSVYGILACIGLIIVYMYFYKYCKKIARSKILEVS